MDVRIWYYEEKGKTGSEHDMLKYLWEAYQELLLELQGGSNG